MDIAKPPFKATILAECSVAMVFNGSVRPAHSVVTTLRRREDRAGGATRPLSEFAEYLMSGGDGFVDHLRRVSAREEQSFELTAGHVDAAID